MRKDEDEEDTAKRPAIPKQQTPLAESPPGVEALSGSGVSPGDGADRNRPPHSDGLHASGAKAIIPKRPRAKKPVVLEITMQGAQVKAWYEQIRGAKMRLTEKNVSACNSLGDDEDVTLESLQAVIEHLDGLKWVKEHDFAIDIQVLADDSSRLNFEKNWPVVKRKQEQSRASTADEYGNDYSIAGMMAASTPVCREVG